MIVLDASVVGAWFIEGQATPASERLLDRARDLAFIAPSLFVFEVANVFATAERKRRFTRERTRESVERLWSFRLDLDVGVDADVLDDLVLLAGEETLTAYDAAYLRLAWKRRAMLASKDSDLLDAARRRGVAVEDLR